MQKPELDRRTLLAIGALSAAVAPLKTLAQTSASTPNEPGPYDLVITGGRVMDPETNYDAVANVGIRGGRIAVITKKKITGKETIDAGGLVLAPGFIDTHFHWTRPIGYKLALRDGVTTAMDLEAGVYGPRVNDCTRCTLARAR